MYHERLPRTRNLQVLYVCLTSRFAFSFAVGANAQGKEKSRSTFVLIKAAPACEDIPRKRNVLRTRGLR